jgi:hypothetical protein
MMSDDKQIELLREALEARLDDVEAELTSMRKIFGTWLDGQVAQARQTISKPQQGAVDAQVAFINARAAERQAKGRDAPVKLADAGFDAQTSRIAGKRQELLGAKKNP